MRIDPQVQALLFFVGCTAACAVVVALALIGAADAWLVVPGVLGIVLGGYMVARAVSVVRDRNETD
jgi:hypothetical protein